jgi:hypothetical protein
LCGGGKAEMSRNADKRLHLDQTIGRHPAPPSDLYAFLLKADPDSIAEY